MTDLSIVEIEKGTTYLSIHVNNMFFFILIFQ